MPPRSAWSGPSEPDGDAARSPRSRGWTAPRAAQVRPAAPGHDDRREYARPDDPHGEPRPGPGRGARGRRPSRRAVRKLARRDPRRGDPAPRDQERRGAGPPAGGEPGDVGPGERDRARPRRKKHLLDPGDPLFAALRADADKRRQVDAFLRQLVAAAGRTLEAVRADGRPLRVVDLGCGNAYLTFAAHRYLSDLLPGGVRTLGVDVRPDLVARNTRLAGELALSGLEFAVGTIEGADPHGDVDVVLALHACDTATDDALARAVAWRAPVILAAPCCHHDVQRQLDEARAAGVQPPAPHAALVRHPILRERFADVLTDTFRAQLLRLAGYAVDVVEFVDSRHTPRNALIRASRTASPGAGRGGARRRARRAGRRLARPPGARGATGGSGAADG